MKNITRRNFIKLTSASAVAVAHSMSTFEFAHAAGPRPLPAGTPILVIVTL
ncbi:MAG: twin-arginine translocation signal domain-containing protein, partial [Actinobacteria bacterium]|nr:twin-arginine translocation signal domain-containing protein [Actinomycetota bacterium]